MFKCSYIACVCFITLIMFGKGSCAPLAPGYGKLGFTAPIPGTYQLADLGLAGDGKVTDMYGHENSLHHFMHSEQQDKISLLSFVYSTCSDVNGCPLATAVLHQLKARLEKEPTIANHVNLITLSFNPEHDTPQRMQEFASNLLSKSVNWQFLTTNSTQAIQPILKAYGQNIIKVYDAKGNFTDTFNHALRVYLIDQHLHIRNIYNTELLHADVLLSDIKTLLNNDLTKPGLPKKPASLVSIFQAGDNKTSYESKNYLTQSLALSQRSGQAIQLLKTIKKPPLGLPQVPVPVDNPISTKKIALGRKLFFDRRLSMNNTFSCAMCHIPEQGFTSNEMATAVGVEGRTVRRNSPSLINVAYQVTLFHDGRENTLENQVWGPLLAHNEMANPAVGYVINKINASTDYKGLFEQSFGKSASMETIGMALASYERVLNSANSPFDRWYFGGDKFAVSEQAKRGFALFSGKAHCNQCHLIKQDNALFTDNHFHNTGLSFADVMIKDKASQRVQLAPGVFTEVSNTVIGSVSETKINDLGRYEITQKPEDRWRYKTPSLRNIGLTAPYMHNGQLTNLMEVLNFYNKGGITNENLDLLIKPLNLSIAELTDIKEFLETLTGDNVEELVSDAFASPVGDSQ